MAESQEKPSMAAEPQPEYGKKNFNGETVETLRKKMETAAKAYDFVSAAQFRDEMLKLQGKTYRKHL